MSAGLGGHVVRAEPCRIEEKERNAQQDHHKLRFGANEHSVFNLARMIPDQEIQLYQ
jgi:hypothetical protein